MMKGKERKIVIKIPSLALKENFWKIVSVFLLIALVGSLYLNITGKTVFPIQRYSASEIGEKVIKFINNNLVQPGTSASLVSVRDMGSYYEIVTNYQGQQIPVYASKDGKVLFLQAISMERFEQTVSREVQQTPEEIPKREKPDVKLFIMSYCPFGLQALKALLPVMNLLKDKASISLHFVDYIMHGEEEVYENLRMYCIQKEQRERLYDYLLCFVQSGDYQKCLRDANVNVEKLNDCMNKTDKEYNITKLYQDKSTWLNGRYPIFPIDKELNERYGVRGSPTMIINDKEVRVSRSPEAFKQAICKAFVDPPKECEQTLSTEVASPGIGSLSGGSVSSGSCG